MLDENMLCSLCSSFFEGNKLKQSAFGADGGGRRTEDGVQGCENLLGMDLEAGLITQVHAPALWH